MNSKSLTFCSIFSVAILLFSLSIFSNSIYAQKEFSVRNVGHFGGYASTVAVSGNYAFFCQGPVLSVLEITESGFIKKASLTLPSEPGESFIYNNYLYLSQWFDSLRVIDIMDPLNPVFVASLHVRQGGTNWGQAKITASGNYLYLTLGDSVKIIDISIP